jgi:putative DNA primase/helicase
MDFYSFAEANGLLIRDLVGDGKIHRCPTQAKPRSDNGAYMLNQDRGWIMDWAAGDHVLWWHDERAAPWTEAQKREARKKASAGALEKAKRQRLAGLQAIRLIGDATLLIPCAGRAWRPGRPAVEAIPAHPYLVRKGFPMELGFVDGEDLLIPMFDAQEYGQPIGLQRINPAGEKKFLPGMRAKGAVHRFGTGRARETWLCEGYATALSVRAALKALYREADVIACFSAGNMTHVASLGIGTHCMADHDKSGAGEDAAQATGLPYAMPGTLGFDANDVHCADGLGAVVALVARRI